MGGDEFDPVRWTKGRQPKNLSDAYKPFGTGMRACIGRQFAYHEIQLALATVVRSFDFTADPDYVLMVNETITLEPAEMRSQLHAK